MRTASSVLAVESRGVPHEALTSSTDSETSSPDDCSGYSYHSTTPAASPSSSWQEHQEHINAELISLEQQVLAEALEGQLTGPEAIEVSKAQGVTCDAHPTRMCTLYTPSLAHLASLLTWPPAHLEGGDRGGDVPGGHQRGERRDVYRVRCNR